MALSRAMGTCLEEADAAAWYETLRRLAPDGKTSMLQDVEAHRKAEVEAFAGTVMALAGPARLEVPVNRTLYRLIRALDRGYGCP